MVLLYSSNSAASDAVELEWCTAIALKKPVLPVRAGDIALPAILRSVHFAQANDTVEKIAGALHQLVGVPEERPAERDNRVLELLAQVPDGDVAAVLAEARRRKIVPGRRSRWWLATLFAPAAFAGWLVYHWLPPRPVVVTADLAHAAPVPAVVAGIIHDKSGNPVADVEVSAPGRGARINTDRDGFYRLVLPTPVDGSIKLTATKPGFEPYSGYVTSGNEGHNFVLERRP